MIKFPQFVELAHDWHGGPNSALYLFASTGGTVHTVGHLQRLLKEVGALPDADGVGAFYEFLETFYEGSYRQR